MNKTGNVLFAIFDAFIMLGLLIKVLVGDADVVDYIGLTGVALVGISCIHSLVCPRKAKDAEA